MNKSLVLTGMMGVGKTTIGRRLAKKLSYKFIDVDKLIENKEGSSINQIFKDKSENYFRQLEIKMSLQELKKSRSVISLGGGAFLNNSIRRTVKNLSTSFWLDVDVDLLINRLKKANKRPLLFNKNLKETINKIYLERKNIYNKADFKIICKSMKPDAIVEKILKLYENSRN